MRRPRGAPGGDVPARPLAYVRGWLSHRDWAKLRERPSTRGCGESWGDGIVPTVNPEILTWARETAGLTLERAADAIELPAARGLSGAERLEALEREGEPSRALLRRMAETYRRPLIVFYLKQPPARGNRGEDFRRAPDAPPLEYDPQLDTLIRNVRARHNLAKSLLEDEEASALGFVGSHTMEQGAQAVAESIRTTIGFDLAEFRRARDFTAAFNYLRACLERQGIGQRVLVVRPA